MKPIVMMLLAIFLLPSCADNNKATQHVKPRIINPIEGSWKLVYAHILEKDSLQVKDLSKTDFIKIINATHFAFFNQEEGTSENFMAGGGSYTFNGSDYTETLDFINAPDYRGHVFPFKAEVKGDSLIQQGHEKLEAAGLDRYILEKYVRIKSEN